MSVRIRTWGMILWACIVVCAGCAPPQESGDIPPTLAVATSPSVGRVEGATAPDFRLASVDGPEVALSDLRGQVVMLNFWAVWCGFCRIEMPEIQAAYEAHRNRGFVVLGIDVQEEADVVREYAGDLGITFPLLLDRDIEVTLAYGVRGLPTSVFIDPEGVISAIHIGPLDQATIERYLADIGVQ